MTSADPYFGKIRFRACGLIVEDRKILLVKQNVPTRDHPVWLPPGGGVHTGELIEDAVVREVREETHLNTSKPKLRYVHEFIHSRVHAIEFYFRMGSYSGELKNGFDPEHPEDEQLIHLAQFVEFSRLDSIKLIPAFLQKELIEGNFFEDRITYFKTQEK